MAQMATPDGRALGQQDDGGFGQFFRGDLPKKLGLLLVRRAASSDVASPQIAASASREPSAMQIAAFLLPAEPWGGRGRDCFSASDFLLATGRRW